MPSDIQIYQTDDRNTQIDVELDQETVWLSQAQMVDLFDKNKRTISEHIRNIFKDGEPQEESVVRKSRTTATDGKAYNVTFCLIKHMLSAGREA